MALGAMLVLALGIGWDGGLPQSELRVYDPTLKQLLQDGHERSATLRALQSEFAGTGWLLFVQRGRCPEREAVGCLMHFVGRFEDRPFLRVVVNPDLLSRDRVIGILAHELQHAIEVASAPDITDAASIEALFRRIGRAWIKRQWVTTYETDAAQRAGEAVLRDLRAKRD